MAVRIRLGWCHEQPTVPAVSRKCPIPNFKYKYIPVRSLSISESLYIGLMIPFSDLPVGHSIRWWCADLIVHTDKRIVLGHEARSS